MRNYHLKRNDELKIELSPSGSSEKEFIKLKAEIPGRLTLGAYSFYDLSVQAVHYKGATPYLVSDFSNKHQANYPRAGSMGCIVRTPDGRNASIYVVNFYDLKAGHHNPHLWGRDFDGRTFYDKDIPFHDTVPLDTTLKVKLTIGDESIEEYYKPANYELSGCEESF